MDMLSNVNEDSILIFEYFTASGVDDGTILSEAIEIIRSLLLELRDLDTYVLVSKDFENIFDDIFDKYSDCNVKVIVLEKHSETSLEDWLNENISIFSKSMFIADENNMNLYNLTNILEKNNIKIYGSDSFAVKISSDKYEIFNYFDGKLKQPKTFNICIDFDTYWKRDTEVFFNKINNLEDSTQSINSKKVIVKPRYGVDCEGIRIIESIGDIGNLDKICGDRSHFLVQEFIEGIVASVSLICSDEVAIPISLNKQIVEIKTNVGEYFGGEIPFEHPLKDKAFELAKKACEYVPGAKGFVGVDIIINEDANDVYLIEINSRFTTSYVGLQKIANFNIAKSIIDLLDGNIVEEDIFDKISYNGKISFLKDKNGILDIKKFN